MNSQNKTKSVAKSGFAQMGDLFSDFQIEDKGGYITQEFQDYGYRLALDLDDLKHKSLYIKLAKSEKRIILEKARTFVIDSNAKSKGKLFMWKLKQLKQEKQ